MALDVNIQKKLGSFHLSVQIKNQKNSFGLLGTSGSGKSMTLKCIAGIEKPDTGRIVLNDRILFDSEKKINLKPQARKIGYLFQNYALFPNMTVAQNIGCVLMHLTKEQRKERIEELLSVFKLIGLEDCYPRQLSGGQQQRIAFARILAYDPELLLLDEPFAALDSQLKEYLQVELFELLKKYAGNVILVTHSQDEAYRLCQDILIIDQGQPLITGNTKKLFYSPQLLNAARLTGCKNIVKIRRLGSYEVLAEEWGVPLRTKSEVTDDITHIGIRAHDFSCWSDKPEPDTNCIPVDMLDYMETPFEWNIFLKSNASIHPNKIWWKCARPTFRIGQTVRWLSVQPECVMLLRENKFIKRKE